MRSGHWLVFALGVTMGTSLAAKDASSTRRKSPVHSLGLIPPVAQQPPVIDPRRKRVVEPQTPVVAQADEPEASQLPAPLLTTDANDPQTQVAALTDEPEASQLPKRRRSFAEILGLIGEALVVGGGGELNYRNGFERDQRSQLDPDGSITPGAGGGMIIGGPLGGSILPGSKGGMIIGGPLAGTILPGAEGGMIIGGPLGGSIMPGAEGGMIIGGPLGGSILPGSKGGMIIGGPLSGTILPATN